MVLCSLRTIKYNYSRDVSAILILLWSFLYLRLRTQITGLGMVILSTVYRLYFAQPWWLLGCLFVIPVIWLGFRYLGGLSRARRVMAVAARCVLILILIALLARLTRARKSDEVAVIAVIDRSLSIPSELQKAGLDYLRRAVSEKPAEDMFAVVDVAETASISKLPGKDRTLRERNSTLTGEQTNLADGIEMAMAIAPPDAGVRIVLISEGNQTSGDLKEAARTTAMNKVPIDVLAVRYEYEREVIFRRMAAPTRARSGQTVSLRFILNSTAPARGRLLLTLNDNPIDLVPDSPEVAAPVNLKVGTNVKTISLPVGMRGTHEFKAVFIPEDSSLDRIEQNNTASAMTFVSGPGHVMVCGVDAEVCKGFCEALRESEINCRYRPADEFPDNLAMLMDVDAVVLVNTDSSRFTFQQQQMLCRYVTELGGGFIMIGGAESFGAGGWIGSPVADILPVECEPPQKKQMPLGVLVLVIDRSGSMAGEKLEASKVAAVAAARGLSRLDYIGVVFFDSQAEWLVPLQLAEDKDSISRSIRGLVSGGGTDVYAGLVEAAKALQEHRSGVRHVILLTDGQTAGADCRPLAAQMGNNDITITTVAVGPNADKKLLYYIARVAGGRFYPVSDPQKVPQIFVKEAQVVRRSLIVEESFVPIVTYSLSEILKGLQMPLPGLDGYVLTGLKGGLSQTVLSKGEGDPVLATCQAGLGRCLAFTSSVDSRWASNWLNWGGFGRFWEQAVRWSARPSQPSDCEVMVDVKRRWVNVGVESLDEQGDFMQLAHIDAQVIKPDMSTSEMEFSQVGPGQFQGNFQAGSSGSYIVNVRYRQLGEDKPMRFVQAPVTVPFAPEFRDLRDNAPLLAEVSKITGGRILGADPAQAGLFSHEGLKFPESRLPLTRPLLLAWIVVLLLDVAVRRVVIDFRAIGAKLVSLVKRRPKAAKGGQTLERLRKRRSKIRRQLFKRGKEAASRRYGGADENKAELPRTKIEPERKKEAVKPAENPEPQKTTEKEVPSHIERLKKAKEKAREKKDQKQNDDN